MLKGIATQRKHSDHENLKSKIQNLLVSPEQCILTFSKLHLDYLSFPPQNKIFTLQLYFYNHLLFNHLKVNVLLPYASELVSLH